MRLSLACVIDCRPDRITDSTPGAEYGVIHVTVLIDDLIFKEWTLKGGGGLGGSWGAGGGECLLVQARLHGVN